MVRCWNLRKREESKILSTEMGWLRKILGVSRLRKVRNETVMNILEQKETKEETDTRQTEVEAFRAASSSADGREQGRRRSCYVWWHLTDNSNTAWVCTLWVPLVSNVRHDNSAIFQRNGNEKHPTFGPIATHHNRHIREWERERDGSWWNCCTCVCTTVSWCDKIRSLVCRLRYQTDWRIKLTDNAENLERSQVDRWRLAGQVITGWRNSGLLAADVHKPTFDGLMLSVSDLPATYGAIQMCFDWWVTDWYPGYLLLAVWLSGNALALINVVALYIGPV